MHRIGGIEKQDGTGNVSYEAENHSFMVHLRAERIDRIADDIPAAVVEGDEDADVLVLGWGSTWGAITSATRRVRKAGKKVAHVHLVHLNPFPSNLGELLGRYRTVLVPEMNLGQLSMLVRAKYLVDATPVTKVSGQPFTAGELEQAILGAIG
jgi:2-oxoglutarate ferredoxin oxidoreductase subunit alpha